MQRLFVICGICCRICNLWKSPESASFTTSQQVCLKTPLLLHQGAVIPWKRMLFDRQSKFRERFTLRRGQIHRLRCVGTQGHRAGSQINEVLWIAKPQKLEKVEICNGNTKNVCTHNARNAKLGEMSITKVDITCIDFNYLIKLLNNNNQCTLFSIELTTISMLLPKWV